MLVIIFVSVFIIIGLYIHGDYKEYMAAFEWIRYENMMRPIEEKKAQIEAARKVDYVGGQTPEETLEMYIKTFKSSDIEGSIKYYDVAYQEKEREFDKKLNFNNAVKWLDDVQKLGKGQYSTSTGYYSIGYVNVAKTDVSTTTISVDGSVVPLTIKKGSTTTIRMIFIKNFYTNVWKIVQ